MASDKRNLILSIKNLSFQKKL